ncbi:MAG: cation:proton antiporter [Candidatus Hodarchaeota archaeon]
MNYRNMTPSNVDEGTIFILLTEIGLVIIFAMLVAKLLGKRGIPQVLGLIVGGLFLQFIAKAAKVSLNPSSDINFIVTAGALGFIGYSIGAELDLRELHKESWGLVLILVTESIGSLIIVTFMIWMVFQDLILAFLLGAIAMATAPASTAEVLGEYNSKGPLSSTILFILAFDDILAILFFSLALSYSESYYGDVSLSLVDSIVPILVELVGSVLLGLVLALALKIHVEGAEASGRAEFLFPAIIVCIGIAGLLHFSIILSTIIFGLTHASLTNNGHSESIIEVEKLADPIIALFFILVGLEMNLGLFIDFTITALVLIYFLSRALGKSFGAWSGATVANMPKNVRQYLPFSLLTQAGVALGLAALAFTRLSNLGTPKATDTAILLLNIVTLSVMMTEIVGPLLVKWAIHRSGEVSMTKKFSPIPDSTKGWA